MCWFSASVWRGRCAGLVHQYREEDCVSLVDQYGEEDVLV